VAVCPAETLSSSASLRLRSSRMTSSAKILHEEH
jgi:hypothetical protein